MPRGSKIGERRGGRDRGTPNRRTVLIDRILEIASEQPPMDATRFIDVLLKDPELPGDLRIAIARNIMASEGRAGRSSTNRRKSAGPRRGPSGTAKPAGLEILLNILLDPKMPADQRRKAALEATRHLLPKKPSVKRWWVNAPIDEYGFAITPEIASEYRDTKFELQHLARSGSDNPRRTQKVEKLKARMTAILLRLQCPCPYWYGEKQLTEDHDRLCYFLRQRETNGALSADESAEEAHCTARLASFNVGPEAAARRRLQVLKDKERLARRRRLRLPQREGTDLRFLRLLYPNPKTPHDDLSSDVLHPFLSDLYYPLRDEPVADDGNLYPPDSKLRPPKDDEIEEEFVEIAKYCYPPHARLPPHHQADIIYVDKAGFRWSNKLLG